VVEVAVIHLDNHTPYELTMGYIARYLSKSRAQLNGAVWRLVQDGLLALDAAAPAGEAIADNCRVFPTQAALRELPAFRELNDDALSREISDLHHR